MNWFQSKVLVLFVLCCISPLTLAKPKILCLHGGGGNAQSMEYITTDLRNALPEFEFVYANGAYGYGNSKLWIADPPGGKDEPTTDPGWADLSIEALDEIRAEQGPFYGILGYSQGAAFVPVYLSRVPPNTFQVAITFCGYLTTTHLGLLGKVNEESPFSDIPHLVWMGAYDYWITNPMTYAMSEKFTDPSIVVSPSGGHNVPESNDDTFNEVVSFIQAPPVLECTTIDSKETCNDTEFCSWWPKKSKCKDALTNDECSEWNGSKNKCKKRGCRWKKSKMKCKGRWGNYNM